MGKAIGVAADEKEAGVTGGDSDKNENVRLYSFSLPSFPFCYLIHSKMEYTTDLFCEIGSNKHIEFNVVSVYSVVCFSIEQIY